MNKLECVYLARLVLENKNTIILNTKTTGLHNCEIVQIAIIDLSGNTLLNTLVKPTCKIEPAATAIHGITQETVKDAPSFKDIYEQIKSIINKKTVLIYNADFDTRVLDFCCETYSLPCFEFEEFCIMHLYSEFVGEWNDFYQTNRWQKLPGGDHTALGDCVATLEVIKLITNSSVNEAELEAIKEEDFIPF